MGPLVQPGGSASQRVVSRSGTLSRPPVTGLEGPQGCQAFPSSGVLTTRQDVPMFAVKVPSELNCGSEASWPGREGVKRGGEASGLFDPAAVRPALSVPPWETRFSPLDRLPAPPLGGVCGGPASP